MDKYFVNPVAENEQNQHYTPNDETIKALEESKRGIGINQYSSFEEMIDKITKEIAQDG